jgi:hypothetical protein
LAGENIGQAAQCVWRAMFYANEWPDQLQQQANTLIPLLFRFGTIQDTVEQLSADDLRTLRVQLGSLIDEAMRSEGIEFEALSQ